MERECSGLARINLRNYVASDLDFRLLLEAVKQTKNK